VPGDLTKVTFRENTSSGKVREMPKFGQGTKEVAKAMAGEKTHQGVRFDRLSMAKDKPHHGPVK
jgi:hypothetical protein